MSSIDQNDLERIGVRSVSVETMQNDVMERARADMAEAAAANNKFGKQVAAIDLQLTELNKQRDELDERCKSSSTLLESVRAEAESGANASEALEELRLRVKGLRHRRTLLNRNIEQLERDRKRAYLSSVELQRTQAEMAKRIEGIVDRGDTEQDEAVRLGLITPLEAENRRKGDGNASATTTTTTTIASESSTKSGANRRSISVSVAAQARHLERRLRAQGPRPSIRTLSEVESERRQWHEPVYNDYLARRASMMRGGKRRRSRKRSNRDWQLEESSSASEADDDIAALLDEDDGQERRRRQNRSAAKQRRVAQRLNSARESVRRSRKRSKKNDDADDDDDEDADYDNAEESGSKEAAAANNNNIMEVDTDEEEEDEQLKVWLDDGDPNLYELRLRLWLRQRRRREKRRRARARRINGDSDEESSEENVYEAETESEESDDEDDVALHAWTRSAALRKCRRHTEKILDAFGALPSVQFRGDFELPKEIYESLYGYQQTGVRWLWELHCQQTGGIVGDEMGLGKTVMTATFLGGLHYSELLDGPVLIVCPATVMEQWTRELHYWWPPFRVCLLHESGVHAGRRRTLMDEMRGGADILITTYDALRRQQRRLLSIDWSYVILDEGHKIRNPDAEITIVCKRVTTAHRIVLTGTPIQNNLVELWSLFDFVFPGRLGTLPVFKTEFEMAIRQGGYANASQYRVQTAYRCAKALREMIRPYLLRRHKADVLQQLPRKTEQVLFCQLHEAQVSAYRRFLASADLQLIMDGQRNMLFGVDILRKICNHPDLLHRHVDDEQRPRDYGNWQRSGKLIVVRRLLQLWHAEKRKVLLFAQTRQMLDIIEVLVRGEEDWCDSYLRMDGLTAIKQRMQRIDRFNNDADIFVFLLTTKVGGLGINLVGADRVIIFDPDWNPSTDMQARERAWRIGQTKPVVIYRLMTSGTIEEKIYHRQIFKQFLTNKVLSDARQARFLKARDLYDLFTLSDASALGEAQMNGGAAKSETGHLFKELGTEIRPEHVGLHETDQEKAKEADADAFASADEEGGANDANDAIGDDANVLREAGVRMEEADEAASHEDDDEEKKAATANGKAKADGGGNADDGQNASIARNVLEGAGDAEETRDDERILRALFGSGVHSAFRHDAIESGGERALVAREAEQQAAHAVEELRRSRRACATDDISTPTWTGRAGGAGRHDSLRRAFGRGVAPRTSVPTLSRPNATSSTPTGRSAPANGVSGAAAMGIRLGSGDGGGGGGGGNGNGNGNGNVTLRMVPANVSRRAAPSAAPRFGDVTNRLGAPLSAVTERSVSSVLPSARSVDSAAAGAAAASLRAESRSGVFGSAVSGFSAIGGGASVASSSQLLERLASIQGGNGGGGVV